MISLASGNIAAKVVMSALSAAATVVSSVGKRGQLLILFYHRVLPEPDPFRPDDVDAASFDWHVATLARYFNVLPMGEALEKLQRGALPARAACVTFDDGYVDNLEIALPILERWGVPATFFLTTGFLDGALMWNDRVIEAIRHTDKSRLELGELGLESYNVDSLERRCHTAISVIRKLKYLPVSERNVAVSRVQEAAVVDMTDRLMMSAEEIEQLAEAGMEIGGHTVSHPILARITDDEAGAEISSNKGLLEEITGRRIALFAYPNGVPGVDYLAQHVQLVREAGFEAAVSTAWGAVGQDYDRYQLPRVMPWDNSQVRFQLRLVRSYMETQPDTVDTYASEGGGYQGK